mgnify:CR=1 FL=1
MEARIVLQEAIVAKWAADGRDPSGLYALSGLAADVALAAIAAEREACAEVCRARARRFRHGAGAPSDGIVEAVEREARDCAAAIRARGAS